MIDSWILEITMNEKERDPKNSAAPAPPHEKDDPKQRPRPPRWEDFIYPEQRNDILRRFRH